jgi:hypothetical protein
MARGCRVVDKAGECVNPVDKEMGDGFCTDHSYEWRRSDEFHATMRDDGVILAASLRAPKLLSHALRPFKKKWLARMAREES